MPSCVFRRCTNYDAKINKTQGISYHMFPTNPLALHEWISAVREQRKEYDWKPSKSSRVCSNHFSDEHKYMSSQGRKLLKKSAVPIVEKIDYYNAPIYVERLYNDTSDIEEIVVCPTIEVPTLHMNDVAPKRKKNRRKKKLRIQPNKESKKKFASMAIILQIIKKKNFISKEQCAKLKPKTKVIDLINKMHHRDKKKKLYTRNYPLVLRKFALALNFYSSAAYKYVRRIFQTALPHPKILAKWYQNSSFSPGFTKQAFDLLKRKCSGKRVLFNLIVDEMMIRHPNLWTGQKSDALVDFGIGIHTSDEVATHVYVFTIVALNESWKIPVAYFFVKSLSVEIRAYLINTCITKCHHSGAEVVMVTFDSFANNLAVAEHLGCDLSTARNLKSTFRHPICHYQVAILFDPFHMLKLVRNALMSKNIIFDSNNNEIKWKLIDALNKLLTSQGLDFTDKQSQRHINFRNEILKIKLSTQLFSRSLGYALELCDQLIISSQIKDIEATVEFISIFNDLFDIFNSCDQINFKQPISPNNFGNILNFLDKAKEYILSLKVSNKIKWNIKGRTIINVTKKSIVECKLKAGFLSFLICIQNLKQIFRSYVRGATSLLPHIGPYNLTQGIHEILFGLTRFECGTNKNLNTKQFKEMYRKICNHLHLRSYICGNRISLEYIPILPCSSSGISNINFSSGLYEFDDEETANVNTYSDKSTKMNVAIFVDLLNKEHCTDVVKQIIGYISGFIVRKLISIIKCETCVDALYTNQKMWYHKLISIRDMNGLCLSSESVFTICLKSEHFIKRYIIIHGIGPVSNRDIKKLETSIMKSFVTLNIFELLYDHSKLQIPAFNHRMHLIQSIVAEFTNIRFNYCSYITDESERTSKTHKNKKLCLF